MKVGRVGQKTALFLLCATAACSTDAPLETRAPAEPLPLASVLAMSDTLTAQADAFVRSQDPNKNYGSHDTLVVRSFSGNPHLNTASVRFDQASIAARVGEGHLDSAHLQLRIKQVSGWPTAGAWIGVYRLPNAWAPSGWTESGATWNCPNDTNTSNALFDCPVGGWDTTGFGTMEGTDWIRIKNSTAGWLTFDVSADVVADLADTVNAGWYLTKETDFNNQRIVFWSREAADKPRLVLYATADTSYRLSSVLESGVHESLSQQDTLLAPGTVVTYSFTATSGYQNVQVTLDGQSVPASGTVTMSQDRVLIASADRVVTVSTADQALVQSARAVLFSAEPALAFQNYLNQVRQVVASTSPEDAQERLDAIHFLAYDPIEDSAALRRAEESLTNRVFTLGDTALPDTLAEATTLVYVNGTDNDFDEASDAAARFETLVREITLFQGKAFERKLFYNRTFRAEASETPQERTAKCRAMLQRRIKFLGRRSQDQFMLACSVASTPDWTDRDMVESVIQFANVLRNSPAVDIDARVLADSLQLWRARGRHVVVMPHSQGNMMMQQALIDFRGTYNYSEERDSTCVGVMSLAAPTTVNWQLPPYRRKGIVLHRDVVADWGFNEDPRIDNDVSRSARAEMDSLELLGENEGWEAYYGRRIKALGMVLHEANTYMIPSESRTIIKSGLDSLYHSCAAATVSVFAPGVNHPVGSSFQMTAQVRNREFEELKGRKIRWSTSNAAIASVDTNGIVRALSVGTVTITGRSGTVKGQLNLNVHEPSPYPPGVNVFGTWRRTMPDGSGGSCQQTLEIDVDARLRSVCDDGSNPATNFGVSVNAPWISGRLTPLPPTSIRWLIELTGDGNTLKSTFVRFIGDPEPVEMPVFTRP